MNAPIGFAVVDTETTGLFPGYRHRIVEVAVVHLDLDGTVTDEWSTLLNPNRDLGPQAIHGIRAADIRRAPRFEQIVGNIVERVRGRVVVAHNWSFDAMHLRAEFERCDVDTPFHSTAGLCTMAAAGRAMPYSRRSLMECCAAAGLPDMDWHTARDDAMAAAMLLAHLLRGFPQTVRLTDDHMQAAAWSWPVLPCGVVAPVKRTPLGHVEPHFLARLVDRIPRTGDPVADAYLAMLDDALLDRQICATEADALLDLAHSMGLHKADVIDIHHQYLRELAHVIWADGILAVDERRDMDTVAALLGLAPEIVDEVLLAEQAARTKKPSAHCSRRPVAVGGLTLRPGDKVVLTGTMKRGRAEIVAQATAAGLQMANSVSRRTSVVVAADPDSLSAKAKDARAYGVPVVNEHTFMRALESMKA
ncbi:MAG: exonuclease domain-containing protein [Pseudonocardiaceae bacterium]